METRRFSGEYAYLPRETSAQHGSQVVVMNQWRRRYLVIAVWMDSSWNMIVTVLETLLHFAILKTKSRSLALITSKSGDLEDKGEVIARIKEASQLRSA